MPHAELMKHSTTMAAAVGDAHAQALKVRSVPGLPAAAMIALGSLDGALSRISNANVAMGDVAHGLSDEPVAAEEKKAGAVVGDGRGKAAS